MFGGDGGDGVDWWSQDLLTLHLSRILHLQYFLRAWRSVEDRMIMAAQQARFTCSSACLFLDTGRGGGGWGCWRRAAFYIAPLTYLR